MKKFLELLDSLGIVYDIRDGAVVVLDRLAIDELGDIEQISIPENTDFEFGLICNESNVEIQLPENLKVAYILDLVNANVTRLPSNLTIYDDCSVLLDACQFENVSYRDDCGKWERTIFAFWANDDFLIAAGCFAGTYSEFATAVDKKYDGNKAVEYKRNARDCISELAEKLGKTDPFKNQ
ncbi:hypothetical protein [Gilliamella apicola]|uniref:Uncharacterized protein n=1 Tax=Gilliamella apicola TaxID=1196095 RepID=A0A242NEX6_9GAMM|nr:hypothetical protein [Gilliamella apicola]OTP82394.1 hypothetical protein B5S40_07030 [Gilliamella apicola]OTP84539.1 hypothetical protein B5S44_09800 [Gilliamella apicola]OTP98348.1 hypothetical protein B6D08_11440 [Gilliamella apicola]OTQ09429.1 hypothetical protein B6C91_09270 [Gilliamella apicola]OTQ13951.1 hypothetical protein B6D11_09430 [Gilliamella apicola]